MSDVRKTTGSTPQRGNVQESPAAAEQPLSPVTSETPAVTPDSPPDGVDAARPASTVAGGLSQQLELSRPRADKTTLRLELANPLESTTANASASTFVNTAVAVALNRVAERYPEIDRNAATRLMEFAATSLLEIEKSVYLHEGGHFRTAKAAGGSPEISMGFMSGLTSYNFTKATWPDKKTRADMSGAGITQVGLNSRENYVQWALSGDAYYQEAAAYIFESLHAALYAGRSLSLGARAPAYDDIRAYVDTMNENGAALSRGQVFAVGLATALANAPALWRAGEGQWRFLVDGERHGSHLPTFSIGDTTFTWPHFYTALSGSGVFVGSTFLVNPDKRLPVSVDLLARVDEWSAVGARVQLHGVPLIGRNTLGADLYLSPYFGGSIDSRGAFGGLVGTALTARKGDTELSVDVAFKDRDLFSAAAADKTSGLNFGVRLGWRF